MLKEQQNKKSAIRKWIQNRESTFLNGLKENEIVPDAVIEELLENAIWAPSHGLVQAWHFKVFTDKGLDKLYQEQQKIYKQTTSPEKFNQKKYEKFAEKSRFVSHVIVIISKRDPKRRFPRQEDLVSVACATQNIYLSLQAFGIAGYLSTGDICYQQEMRDFLGLEDEDDCIGFFTLGIANEKVSRPSRKRIPAREKTEWIRE
jgi:nitroreductase